MDRISGEAKNAKAPSTVRTTKVKSRAGRPSEAEANERAQRLRLVATEVFIEFGYDRASLEEIAKRAGASKKTIYSLYADKSDLFVDVAGSHLHQILLPYTKLLVDKKSIETSLEDLSVLFINGILGPSQGFMHIVFAESRRFPELGKQFWEQGPLRSYADLARYFQIQIDQKRLFPYDAYLMAKQFSALLLYDVIMQWVTNVQTCMSESRNRVHAKATVASFLRMYGTQPKDRQT